MLVKNIIIPLTELCGALLLAKFSSIWNVLKNYELFDRWLSIDARIKLVYKSLKDFNQKCCYPNTIPLGLHVVLWLLVTTLPT